MLFITPLTLNQNNVETAELFVYDFLMNIVLGGGGGGWGGREGGCCPCFQVTSMIQMFEQRKLNLNSCMTKDLR